MPIEWPWALPHGMIPTDDLNPSELEAEARLEQPILKRLGIRDSALRNPKKVKVQYLRAAGFLGWLGIKPYAMSAMWMLLATGFGTLFFWAMLEYGYNASAGGGVQCAKGAECVEAVGRIPGWAGMLFGFVLGLGVSAVGAVFSMALSRFNTAYAPATVVEVAYRDRGTVAGRMVVAIARVPLLRMATVTKQEGRYIGEEGSNSFGTGRSLLETDQHIPSVTDVRAFYDAMPHQSSWTGVFASATHSWYKLSGAAGTLDRLLKTKRKSNGWSLDPVGNYGLMLMVAALLFAAVMAMSGFDAHAYVLEGLPY